ncbi:hypothetical protein L3V31_14605 [Vibrio sp. J1-1]|uniref:hypothetical protein n=1 Tax=Vibrio sp. J1-1 TaxID=2912251 RepID=UPI001F32D7D1|nr:hypothetical protein [Vibrio sp. J1-1]MCF7482942.1 hypothetical protein [Vibrio sp. J1-1]
MSKENPWENTNSSSKNKRLFGIIAFVILLLIVASASNKSTKPSSSESNYEEPTSTSIAACKSLINRKTMYDIDRLSYIGSDKGNPVITYYVDSDLVHQFRCENDSLKLYAKGAGTWMSM